MTADSLSEPVPSLLVRSLSTSFMTPAGPIVAVDGIDFDVGVGEVVGLVGESGSGKSVTLRSLLGLIRPPGTVAGRVLWQGRNLLELSEERLRLVRGREIALIFQEPMTALNPVLTIGQQIRENLAAHTDLGSGQRRARAIELMQLVGIPSAQRRIEDYPHQFSGGMRQRVMIAIALASHPRLLLADEPTTALDVTIQDQILKLILRLRRDFDMSVLLVTHDLGVVAQTCDRLAVMYAGRIVETGAVAEVFRRPAHAYTQGLLRSVPSGRGQRERLQAISGQPPSLAALPPGCAFAPRCSYRTEACERARPSLVAVAPSRHSACIHHASIVP